MMRAMTRVSTLTTSPYFASISKKFALCGMGPRSAALYHLLNRPDNRTGGEGKAAASFMRQVHGKGR